MPSYPRLHRVFPWVENGAEGEPGHPLYVAAPQGQGRIDNPEHYLTLYVSDDPAGAIGEAFGNHSVWTLDLMAGPPALPGSRRALATFDARDATVLDLDDPSNLLHRHLRPSRVVTRARATTQEWALGILREQGWDGVRWWSFHIPEWGSFGLWNISALKLLEITPLSDQLELVRRVATEMNRIWEG